MADSSKRINAEIRQTVIKNLIAKKFAEERLEVKRLEEEHVSLKQKRRSLAYKACFTKKQIEMLSSAPAGWFGLTDSGSIRIEHEPGNYEDRDVSFGESMPVPYKNHWHGGKAFCAVIGKDHEYVKAHEAENDLKREIHKARDDLREKEHAATEKITTILNSVTTVKKLLETWPAVREYLPETVSGEGGGLPATMIDDINKEFGL